MDSRREGWEMVRAESRPAKALILLAFLLVAGTVLLYLPVAQYDFVNFNDDDYVTANGPVRAGLTAQGVLWAFSTIHAGNWHPLTWISLMLDVSLFGVRAGALHLVNVALHALAAVLLLVALSRMTGTLWPAALAAALFVVHPLHVESVAWV
jgi:hypothetical protein